MQKNDQNPERSERVAESEAPITYSGFCHPFHGLRLSFRCCRGCTRCAGLPLPYIFRPSQGSKFRSAAATHTMQNNNLSICFLMVLSRKLYSFIAFANFDEQIYQQIWNRLPQSVPLHPGGKTGRLTYGFRIRKSWLIKLVFWMV